MRDKKELQAIFSPIAAWWPVLVGEIRRSNMSVENAEHILKQVQTIQTAVDQMKNYLE